MIQLADQVDSEGQDYIDNILTSKMVPFAGNQSYLSECLRAG